MSDLTVRLVSYNILARCRASEEYYLEMQNSERAPSFTWEHRISLIKNEILSFDADILCLQDIEEDSMEEIRENLGSGYGYKLDLHRDERSGCAIFYRKSKLVLEGRIQPFYYNDHTARIAQIAKFKIGDRSLGVVNVDLSVPSFGNWINEAQMQKLLMHIDEIKERGEEWVISGSFQAGHVSPVTQTLEDASYVHDYSTGYTVNAHQNLNTTDHVFHTSGITSQTYVNYHLQTTTPMPNGYRGSDHVALIADLTLSQRDPQEEQLVSQNQSKNPIAAFFDYLQFFFKALLHCIFCNFKIS